MDNSELIVILGASENPSRPSYMANKLLNNKGYKTIGIASGFEKARLLDDLTSVTQDKTVTIFINPKQQKKYYDYLLALKPSRIIFNPGTENDELKAIAIKNNIQVLSGCTIAMLMNSML